MRHDRRYINKGYSFVEMLIVLAIMAIMATMALITWNSVDSARYRNAVVTFESELSTLRTATMGQGSEMAMKIYYDSNYKDRFNKPIGAYVIKRGYCDSSGNFHELSFSDLSTLTGSYSHLAKSDYYRYSGVSDPVFVMQKGTIRYSDSGAGATDIGATGVVIRFNKSDGSLLSGSGRFEVVKANGSKVADINIVRITGAYYETY